MTRPPATKDTYYKGRGEHSVNQLEAMIEALVEENINLNSAWKPADVSNTNNGRADSAKAWVSERIKYISSPAERTMWSPEYDRAFKAGWDARDEEVKRLREALEKTARLPDYCYVGLTGAYGNALTAAIKAATEALKDSNG